MFRRSLWVALCGALAFASVAHAAGTPFTLSARQRLAFDGTVHKSEEKDVGGVEFGVIPTHPPLVEARLNQLNQFEQHVTPAIDHPVPVLRAAHVALYRERPDLGKVGLDVVRAIAREATLSEDQRFAVVADGGKAVRLLTFTKVALPQDRDGDWRVEGTLESLSLPEHVDDAVADRGRAIETKEPLPLSGRLIFGTARDGATPAAFHAYDFATAKARKLADTHAAVMANDGTIVDCPDVRTVDVLDNSGKRVAHLDLTPMREEVHQMNVAPDGRRFALTVDRYDNNPADPHHEIVTVAYSIDGRKIGEVPGYDDPAFLPDGRLLLTGPGIEPGLYVGDPKTGKATPLAIRDGDAKPNWPRCVVASPDGKWVAYQSRHAVWLVGIDGGGCQQVWANTNQPQASPVFSPDGNYVAMVVLPPEHWNGPGTVQVFDVRKHLRQVLAGTVGADADIPLVWQP